MTAPHAQEIAATVENAASVAKAVTYGGGGVAGIGGFVLSSQGAALVGVVIAFAGLVANLYFNAERRRLDLLRDAREEREFQARMAALKLPGK